MKQVRKELMAELPDAQALGANELTTRTVPRWLRMELIPGERLRPNAHKMMLRPEEEAQLPLVRPPANAEPVAAASWPGQAMKALG